MDVTLNICVTCRKSEKLLDASEDHAPTDQDPRPGDLLYEKLSRKTLPEGVLLNPVKCLSACSNGCAIAITGKDRWSYVYGHMDPDVHADDILSGIEAYQKSDDGLVPWRERPEIFRKQVLSRIPPLPEALNSENESD